MASQIGSKSKNTAFKRNEVSFEYFNQFLFRPNPVVFWLELVFIADHPGVFFCTHVGQAQLIAVHGVAPPDSPDFCTAFVWPVSIALKLVHQVDA
jgi:hypothetical protein